MRVTILFDNFGPYHYARMAAAARTCELTGIEVHQSSSDYAWRRREGPLPFRLHPLWSSREAAFRNDGTRAGAVNTALQQILPEAVMVPGWSSAAALAALSWCLRQGVPAVLMSESTAWDQSRVRWKEWMKKRIVRLFSSGLVGGSLQRDYLVRLGLPESRVFLGYDAVDNGYFEGKIEEIRKRKAESRSRYRLPERYFLASARFVEKKNLPRLVKAYALYREKTESRRQKGGEGKTSGRLAPGPGPSAYRPWDLVLLGDGPLRPVLDSHLSTLNLHGHVLLPGFKQYRDLPAYYGLAGAFIHASTTEQWGLVVNEAMASGLPVLVSNRCGCAPDLVREGVNGFSFDPDNVEKLAQLMLEVSAYNFPLSAFGDASRRIISEWGPERFASGLKAGVDCALAVGLKNASPLDRILLCALLAR